MAWNDISDKNSSFKTFTLDGGKDNSILLEEVNKGWDRPFHFIMSLFNTKLIDIDGVVYPIKNETLYLSIDEFSYETAQIKARELFGI